MTLRELCDTAEVTRMALEDRREQLRLLALLARAQGAQDMEDYQPPSEQMADWLAGDDDDDPAGRGLEVTRFIAETGGG